jgi:hypothetical protein
VPFFVRARVSAYTDWAAEKSCSAHVTTSTRSLTLARFNHPHAQLFKYTLLHFMFRLLAALAAASQDAATQFAERKTLAAPAPHFQ